MIFKKTSDFQLQIFLFLLRVTRFLIYVYICVCVRLRILVDSFFETMEKTGGDFTATFRCLSNFPLPGCLNFDDRMVEAKEQLLVQCSSVEELRSSYAPRMDPRSVKIPVGLT